MNYSANTNSLLIAVFTPLVVFAISIGLIIWVLPFSDPSLAMGVTYDMALVAPIAYLIAIWNKPIPKISVVPIFMIGILLATWFIPEGNQQHLNLVKTFGVPAVEMIVITFILIKTRNMIRAFKGVNRTTSDFYDVLKRVSAEVLNSQKIGAIFTTEISMISYGLLFWKTKPVERDHFSGYKENAFVATFIAILCILIVETVIVHYLLMRWNSIVAWVILALSLYSGLQILGHLKATTQRLSQLTPENIHIKYGLFGDACIPYGIINKIELNSKTPDDPKSFHKFALLGELESHNISIELEEPITVELAYGFSKQTKTILLHIDQPSLFIDRVNERIL